jgi:hypothetical protein
MDRIPNKTGPISILLILFILSGTLHVGCCFFNGLLEPGSWNRQPVHLPPARRASALAFCRAAR